MGKSAPAPPDYGPVSEASQKAAELAYQTSQDQLAWAKQQWAGQQDLLKQIVDQQQAVQDEQLKNARADRARYEQLYQPLETNLIQDFQNYDTQARRQLEAGQAVSDVSRAYEAQRQNAQRQLESYGIDPSQTRAQALDLGMRSQEAASQAAAGTQAARRVEDIGRSLRAEAINIGRGYPSQVAGAYGQSLAAGQGAGSSYNAGIGTAANTMGTGVQWSGAGNNAANTNISALNTGYQNQLAQADIGNQAIATGVGTIAGLI